MTWNARPIRNVLGTNASQTRDHIQCKRCLRYIEFRDIYMFNGFKYCSYFCRQLDMNKIKNISVK